MFFTLPRRRVCLFSARSVEPSQTPHRQLPLLTVPTLPPTAEATS